RAPAPASGATPASSVQSAPPARSASLEQSASSAQGVPPGQSAAPGQSVSSPRNVASEQGVSSDVRPSSPRRAEPAAQANTPLASDCSDLEARWAERSCEERRACLTQLAGDARTAATVAPSDLVAMYEARARLFQR